MLKAPPRPQLPKPYYDDGKGIVIYHGDSRQLVSRLGRFDLLLTDPPYAIGADKGKQGRGYGGSIMQGKKRVETQREYEGDWDDEPPTKEFLAQIVSLAKVSIIWGGNYFELPVQKKWLVWDKLNTMPTFSDCELAWTTLPGVSVKKFELNGNGLMAKEKDREHPTQKPADLIRWCISLVKDCETIFDPYMGSGTTLRAAKDLGKRCVGIEREEKYCEFAARRLQQEVLL